MRAFNELFSWLAWPEKMLMLRGFYILEDQCIMRSTMATSDRQSRQDEALLLAGDSSPLWSRQAFCSR